MQHLLRQGRFGVAEKFAQSASVEVDDDSKARHAAPSPRLSARRGAAR